MRIVLLLALLAACGKSSPPPAAAAPESPVHVDRRVETIAILEWLANSDEYRTSETTPYLADVAKQLGAFADHRAVDITRELHARGVAFEQPMQLAIRLDEHYQLATGAAAELCNDPNGRAWCGVDVAGYAAQIAKFAATANLDGFYAAHASYIAAAEQRFRDALAKEHPAEWLTDMFGPGAKFTVVPALVQGPHNYGIHRGTDTYQLMGLGVPDANGLPVVGDEALMLVVHEMAHSFINPLVDKHFDELKPLAEPLFRLEAKAMQRQHYTNVRVMLYESFVRALTATYVRVKRGDRAAGDAIRGEVRRGFPWTAELANALDHFRSSHLPFEQYWPQLIAIFHTLDKQYEHGLPPTPFLGPIDAVVTARPLVIVRGPDMSDLYLQPLREKLVTDLDTATTRSLDDHPQTAVLAFGAAAGNPVVAEVARRAGWKLDATGLVLGTKRFAGPNIVLIACWPREDDPSRGIVVYTGATDDDVKGILSLFAGDTDWVVGQWQPGHSQLKLLAAGDFPHAADGAWLLP